MIPQFIQRLEARTFRSSTPLAGTELIWNDDKPGVAGERHSSAIVAEANGGIVPMSGLLVRFALRGSTTTSLGRARMQDGIAVINATMPRHAGHYRIVAAAGGRFISEQFVVQGAAASRMRLTGSAFLGNGEYGFTLEFRDRFGNLATSDTSTLSFKVHTLVGTLPILENDPFRISGVLSLRSVEVGNAGMNPGYANLEIIAQGSNDNPASSGSGEAQVSVEFDDSNSNIPPVFSPVWDAGF